MSRFAWSWEFSISQFLLSVLIRKKEMTTVSKQILSLKLPPLTTGVARIISSLETPVSYTYCREHKEDPGLRSGRSLHWVWIVALGSTQGWLTEL